MSHSRVTRQLHLDGDDSKEGHNNNIMKSEKPGPRESANCAFGIGSDVNMCKWSNLNMSAFHWVSSSGIDSYWIGGPHIDANDKNKEGICRP